MITLRNLKSLMSLDEAVEYFKDVQYVPKEVVEEIKKKLKGPDIDTLSGQEAVGMYYVDITSKLSIQGRDLVDAEMKTWLETYDEKMDQAVLQATDIVKAYNELIEGNFKQYERYAEQLKKYIKKTGDSSTSFGPGTIPGGILMESMSTLTGQYGMSEQDARKYIIGQMFEQTDDPNRIREILKARLNYNKTMIGLLQNTLKANYKILGMSEDMMRAFIEGMESDNDMARTSAIKMTRGALAKEMSDEKYEKNGYYDYRPLGAGVLCISGEHLGDLESFRENKELLAQKLLAYDIVVLGHGNSERKDKAGKEESEKIQKRIGELQRKMGERSQEIEDDNNYGNNAKYRQCDRILKRLESVLDKLSNQTRSLAEKYAEDPSLSAGDYRAAYKKLSDKIDTVEDLYTRVRGRRQEIGKEISQKKQTALEEDKELNKIQADTDKAMKEFVKLEYTKTDDNSEWVIQEVDTPAGKFTQVIPMVEALIKKGFKKIYLMSCNPGHHKLPKSITERKDVTVAMGRNTVIAETQNYANDSQPGDILHESACDIVDADTAIRAYCESIGVDYDDDIALFEAYCEVDDELNYQDFTMNEASGSIWRRLWETAKKVVKAVIWFFKKIIQMCATLVKKIIDRFRKKGKKKLSRKISIKLPIVENAAIKEINGDSYEDISRAATANVQRITKAIKEQERKQNDNLQKYEQYTGKMANSSSTNESVTLTSLRNML